jgi:hypothetical protein
MRLQSMAAICVVCCSWLLPMPVVFAQTPGERLDGEVVNLDDGKLTVRTVAGESVSVVLADGARVMIRVPGDLSNLNKGLYVGATAVPQPDGTLLASQINVFPESMRGTAEGHRPMAALPGNTMTNATVRQAADTMTNASVTGISSPDGARGLVLSYSGGEKTVIVPSGAAVVFSEIGDRSALVRGVHVVVYATRRPDGTLVSERVSIGKNGSVPRS